MLWTWIQYYTGIIKTAVDMTKIMKIVENIIHFLQNSVWKRKYLYMLPTILMKSLAHKQILMHVIVFLLSLSSNHVFASVLQDLMWKCYDRLGFSQCSWLALLMPKAKACCNGIMGYSFNTVCLFGSHPPLSTRLLCLSPLNESHRTIVALFLLFGILC